MLNRLRIISADIQVVLSHTQWLIKLSLNGTNGRLVQECILKSDDVSMEEYVCYNEDTLANILMLVKNL